MKRSVYMRSPEIRCGNCGRLLATGNMELGEIVIACPRCKTRHILRASRPNLAPPQFGKDGLYGDRHVQNPSEQR